jgi:putative tricarboxylic transport membrane protein
LNFSFGQNWLEQGLVIPLIITVCFVIPNLWSNLSNLDQKFKKLFIFKNTIGYIFFLLMKHKWAIIRGTSIGLVCGLIPGVGTSISSNMSWNFEKSLKSSASKQLAAAESANNSAMISCLIPLILFGIPILASENFIIQIMESKGQSIGISWFGQMQGSLTRLEIFCVFGLVISIFMYFVATFFSCFLTRAISKIPLWFYKFLLPFVLIIFFMLDGYFQYRFAATLVTIALCVPMMFYIIKHKINSLPLIFSAMLSTTLIEKAAVVLAIYL